MESVELLKKVRMFRDLPEAGIQKFAAVTRTETFQAKDVIIEQGSEGRALYIIKRGTVSVIKLDGEVTSELVKLVAGEHFGEMSLVENAKTSARVAAHNQVECLVISRSDFEQIVNSDPVLAATVYKAFTQTLCDRLRATSAELVTWKPEVGF